MKKATTAKMKIRSVIGSLSGIRLFRFSAAFLQYNHLTWSTSQHALDCVGKKMAHAPVWVGSKHNQVRVLVAGGAVDLFVHVAFTDQRIGLDFTGNLALHQPCEAAFTFATAFGFRTHCIQMAEREGFLDDIEQRYVPIAFCRKCYGVLDGGDGAGGKIHRHQNFFALAVRWLADLAWHESVRIHTGNMRAMSRQR